jgi:hypothetical protein
MSEAVGITLPMPNRYQKFDDFFLAGTLVVRRMV